MDSHRRARGWEQERQEILCSIALSYAGMGQGWGFCFIRKTLSQSDVGRCFSQPQEVVYVTTQLNLYSPVGERVYSLHGVFLATTCFCLSGSNSWDSGMGRAGMPISDPCTAVWLFLEIKQSCFIFTLQEMDSKFRGRDNRETCALTFSASCQHQEKRNSHPKCQGQCVYRAVGKDLEGHQEFSTDCRSKQDILDTHHLGCTKHVWTSTWELWKRIWASWVAKDGPTERPNSGAARPWLYSLHQGDTRKGPHV